MTKVGGTLLQAEDELASVNMIIGASYGGVPSLTATAGPGTGADDRRASASRCSAEVPIVVVDVMRGGPSTGIPAKSEQSDLSFAVSGLHGDAPRLVLAPTSIADCIATTQWAVQLAEALQAPAIVLSDQFMGQSRAIIDRPADLAFVGKRADRAVEHARLQALPRYRIRRLADGDSGHAGRRLHRRRPRAQRGRHPEQPVTRPSHCSSTSASASCCSTTTAAGGPTSRATASAAVITFGSTTAAAREAVARAARARREGAAGRAALARARAARAACGGTGRRRRACWSSSRTTARSFIATCARCTTCRASRRVSTGPGPLPLRPGELAEAILEWAGNRHAAREELT